MRVVLLDYNRKSAGLVGPMIAAGYHLVDSVPVDALFVDTDFGWAGDRVRLIEQAAQVGAKVYVYPHGAHPICYYDGIAEPHPATTALLVHGPGNKQLQESFGHERPVIDIGWFYCEQRPFEPTEVRNVLFAPVHPWADGITMLEADRERNREAYRKVLGLGVPVTVRYLGELAANGLWEAAGVTFEQGVADNSTASIDRHDLIVSDNATFSYMAVARGKPVVMYGQDHIPVSDDGTQQVKNWGTYKDWIRYPVDLHDGPIDELARSAAAGHPEVPAWKDLWIGDPLTPDRLPR